MAATLQTYAVSLEKSSILPDKMSGGFYTYVCRSLHIRTCKSTHTHVQACAYVCMDTRLLIQAERTCSFIGRPVRFLKKELKQPSKRTYFPK